jgi:hypothetical protein
MDIFSEFTLKFKNSKDFYQQQDAEQVNITCSLLYQYHNLLYIVFCNANI